MASFDLSVVGMVLVKNSKFFIMCGLKQSVDICVALNDFIKGNLRAIVREREFYPMHTQRIDVVGFLCYKKKIILR